MLTLGLLAPFFSLFSNRVLFKRLLGQDARSMYLSCGGEETAMSIAEFARMKLRKLAAPATVNVTNSAVKVVNIISAPLTPAEELGQFWLGLCGSFAGVHLVFTQISEKKKNEDEMTELVEEVRAMREGIKAGFDKVVEAKGAEMKMMKEKENKSWILKFW